MKYTITSTLNESDKHAISQAVHDIQNFTSKIIIPLVNSSNDKHVHNIFVNIAINRTNVMCTDLINFIDTEKDISGMKLLILDHLISSLVEEYRILDSTLWKVDSPDIVESMTKLNKLKNIFCLEHVR